ncbi:Scr1 family TA system antitoxin-like transcriptional regulator [Saccharothrix sp. Mg75]|uniref:Scr1 family TA system antitoxin-like transcriptional regulator n=1 Tax=Saccharothrix sp. Mg75 TaxID=3445357 RepID=UPI003EEFD921
MIPPVATTLRSRLLGRELRRVRETSGLSATELAARTRMSPRQVALLEDGVLDAPAPDAHDMWCRWGADAPRVLNVLCRNAVRVDALAPFGVNPVLPRLDPARCTAYVPEGVEVGRDDVAVRVIPRGAGAYPGVGCDPVTRFGMADGAAVVFYAHPHAALFTDDPDQVRAARTLFARLAALVGP